MVSTPTERFEQLPEPQPQPRFDPRLREDSRVQSLDL
jgi:hypothetical protein